MSYDNYDSNGFPNNGSSTAEPVRGRGGTSGYRQKQAKEEQKKGID